MLIRTAIERGFTLIELIVGMVIMAVGILALATTIPLLTRAGGTDDAERHIREARSCAEVLIALEERGGLRIEAGDCEQENAAPGNWAATNEDEEEVYEGAGAALERFCGVNLSVGCEEDDVAGTLAYRISIGDSAGRFNPIRLLLPREDTD